MTPAQTKLLIAAGIAVTAGLIWFAPSDDATGVSEAAKSGPAPKLRTTTPAASPLEGAGKMLDTKLAVSEERGALNKKDAKTLFAKSTWVVPPPPPPPPAPRPPPPPPPPPTAPPLPFVYMGKFEQGDTNVVILTRGTRVLTVSKGDILEKTYRIDRIEANKVTFTYLPLDMTQTLATGGSQ